MNVEIVNCGKVVRRDTGPCHSGGQTFNLPKSYSPPSAPSSWEDREPWPQVTTVGGVRAGRGGLFISLTSEVFIYITERAPACPTCP